jgi:hypothetical protein
MAGTIFGMDYLFFAPGWRIKKWIIRGKRNDRGD